METGAVTFHNQQMVVDLNYNRFVYVMQENTTMLYSRYVCHAQIETQERTFSSNKNVKTVETCGSTQYLIKDHYKLLLLLRYVMIQQNLIINCILKEQQIVMKRKATFWVLKIS